MVALSKTEEVSSIDLTAITRIIRQCNSDTITFAVGEDSRDLGFLNQTVKAHALERIIPLASKDLLHSVQQKTACRLHCRLLLSRWLVW